MKGLPTVRAFEAIPQIGTVICMLHGCEMDGGSLDRRLGSVADGHNGAQQFIFAYVQIEDHIVVVAHSELHGDVPRNPAERPFASE